MSGENKTFKTVKKEWNKEARSKNTDITWETKDRFAKVLRSIDDADNSRWKLADWRYELGLDTLSPEKSHWMTRYINRELKLRKNDDIEKKENVHFARTRNISKGSLLISFCSVAIAFVALLKLFDTGSAVKETENSVCICKYEDDRPYRSKIKETVNKE